MRRWTRSRSTPRPARCCRCSPPTSRRSPTTPTRTTSASTTAATASTCSPSPAARAPPASTAAAACARPRPSAAGSSGSSADRRLRLDVEASLATLKRPVPAPDRQGRRPRAREAASGATTARAARSASTPGSRTARSPSPADRLAAADPPPRHREQRQDDDHGDDDRPHEAGSVAGYVRRTESVPGAGVSSESGGVRLPELDAIPLSGPRARRIARSGTTRDRARPRCPRLAASRPSGRCRRRGS